MRIRSPKDFWAGLIFVAIGGGFVLLAHRYRLGDMHRMGPAMFPTLVGALLVALGVILALRSLVRDGAPVPSFHARPIIMSLLAIALFAIALQWLGLVAAIAVLVLPVFARRWFPFAGPAMFWLLGAAISFVEPLLIPYATAWRVVPSAPISLPV